MNLISLLFVVLVGLVNCQSHQEQVIFHQLAPLRLSQNSSYNTYLVVFKDNVSDQDIKAHYASFHTSSIIMHRYDLGSFKGYAVKITSEKSLYAIRKSSLVKYIEQDQDCYTQDRQLNPPWGLARISHKELSFPNLKEYLYHPDAGKGVTVYVADTGVRISHGEFEGRAVWGKTIPADQPNTDNRGHGTHVAGTIAGKTYGVAKKARIVAVKVLKGDGSGQNSEIIVGLQFILDHFRANPPAKGGVVNLSLGGSYAQALNDATNALVTGGLFVSVAAGNSNADACQSSPSSADKAITVAASDIADARASFSNWGKCVEIFAPGKDITSAYNNTDDETFSLSGTSMAAPHVAGVIAALLSVGAGGSNPASMRTWLISQATAGKISDTKNTPNLLLWSNPPPRFN